MPLIGVGLSNDVSYEVGTQVYILDTTEGKHF